MKERTRGNSGKTIEIGRGGRRDRERGDIIKGWVS